MHLLQPAGSRSGLPKIAYSIHLVLPDADVERDIEVVMIAEANDIVYGLGAGGFSLEVRGGVRLTLRPVPG